MEGPGFRQTLLIASSCLKKDGCNRVKKFTFKNILKKRSKFWEFIRQTFLDTSWKWRIPYIQQFPKMRVVKLKTIIENGAVIFTEI